MYIESADTWDGTVLDVATSTSSGSSTGGTGTRQHRARQSEIVRTQRPVKIGTFLSSYQPELAAILGAEL